MLQTLNLKTKIYTDAEAVDAVRITLENARLRQNRVVKIIHGYGSGGSGGTNKTAIHTFLNGQQLPGKIRSHIPGERLQTGDIEALKRRYSGHAHTFESLKKDRGNQGITLVLL